MPKKVFDVAPLPRSSGDDEWIRQFYAQNYPGIEPMPCDCGFWEPGALVYCQPTPEARAHCKATAVQRLQEIARSKHLDALRKKRVCPPPPHDRAPYSTCRWCGLPIKGRRSKTMRWHPECLTLYFLHTRREDQIPFLLQRDGPGCACCGVIEGRWAPHGEVDPAAARAKDAYYIRLWPADLYAGPFTRVYWSHRMEVDHRVCLELVAHLPDDERRPYFGPDNLQLLLPPCHVRKTNDDRRKIAEARKART